MAKNVGIIGIAQTNYGDDPPLSLEERIFATTQDVLDDAGIGIEELDGIVISSHDQVDGRPISIMVTGGPVGAYGKDLLDVPSSGDHALVLGYMRMLTGMFRTHLVASWSSAEADDLRKVQKITCEPLYQRQLGLYDLSSYALQASAYTNKYSVPTEAAAKVVAKNRAWGKQNPLAHLQEEVSEQQVLNSPYLAWPVRQLMAPPDSQGVVAMILATEEKAKEMGKDNLAWIKGVGWASDTYWMGERDLSVITSLQRAAESAYNLAGIKDPIAEIDIAEIHDVTAYHELMAYEALKFCGPGKGGCLALEGTTSSTGNLPVNPSGGTLSSNPYFATGLVRATEAALQVMGRADGRQIKGVKVALAQATSGFAGQSNSVFILSKSPP